MNTWTKRTILPLLICLAHLGVAPLSTDALAGSIKTWKIKHGGLTDGVNDLEVNTTSTILNKGYTESSFIDKDGKFTKVETFGNGSRNVRFSEPQDSQGNATSLNEGESVKATIEFAGKTAGSVTGATFTKDGRKVDEGTAEVKGPGEKLTSKSDVSLTFYGDTGQDPASVEYFFLSGLSIWTNKTSEEVDAYDTLILPTLPDLELPLITLSPAMSADPSVPSVMELNLTDLLSPEVVDSELFVFAAYEFLTGPDASIANATSAGQFLFAAVPVPVPGTLLLTLAGLPAMAAVRRAGTARRLRLRALG